MDAYFFTRVTGKQPIDFQRESDKTAVVAPAVSGIEASSLYRSILDKPDQARKRKRRTDPPRLSDAIDLNESFICEECKITVLNARRFDHLTSLQHQLSGSEVASQPLVSYPVSNLSRGYVLLKNEGWTHGKGLGVDEDGRKHPIATIFKKDKLGIGNKNESKRKITHTNEDISRQPTRSKVQFQDAIDANARDELRRQAMLRYLNKI